MQMHLSWMQRTSLTKHRENVMYVEVLVNKWPRIFIITLNDIEAGEELLIDYGASYWEKLSLSIMKGKLEKANSRNAELEAHIDTLREQLKIQEATWGGQWKGYKN